MDILNPNNQENFGYHRLIEKYEGLLKENDQEFIEAFEELFIRQGLLFEPLIQSNNKENNLEETFYFIAINFKIVRKILLQKDIKIESIDDLAKKILLYKYCENVDLAILGEENAMKIAYNDEFIIETTDENRRSRIYYATKYNILARKYYQSTIPYPEVKVDGIIAKRYKNSDPNLLVAGIDTSACFKIFGVDNDFLLYTLFDKNGIVLKLTDEEGKLIGRCSGFRNGNVVYMHQARTIYDKLSNHTSDITNTLKRMRNAIEEFSRQLIELTKDDEFPIEHVIILNGFGYINESELEQINPELIERNPMDNLSPDWEKFKSIEGVKYRQSTDDFTTSYQTARSILLLASKDGTGINCLKDIKPGDVDEKYLRPREIPKTINNENLDTIIPILNRINAIYALSTNQEYMPIKELNDIDSITYGEDWYYLVKNNGLTFECYIDLDPRSKLELEKCKVKHRFNLENSEVSRTNKTSSKTR